MWKCCGAEIDGVTPKCDAPTDENFDASRPEKLDAYWQAGVGIVAPTTTMMNSVPSETAPPPPPVTVVSSGTTAAVTAGSSQSSISPAMAGGIPAGVAVGVLLISLLLVFVYKRRRPRAIEEMQISAPLFHGGFDDSRALRRAESPNRGRVGYDQNGSERVDSPFVHALTAPWPLGNIDRKEAAEVETAPRGLHGERVWEMPADGVKARTPLS